MVTKIYNEVQKGLSESYDLFNNPDTWFDSEVEINVEDVKIRCKYTRTRRCVGYECEFAFEGNRYGVFADQCGKAEAFKNYNEIIAWHWVGNSAATTFELFDDCLKAALMAALMAKIK